MIFQEPKVEFVPIDLNKPILTESQPCNTWNTSGGVQVCSGSQPDALGCPGCVNDDYDWEEMVFC